MEELHNQQLSIKVSEHGAELTSIVCEQKEYLWQANPDFWKRHAPVLFPIVGRLWNDEYRHNGQTFHMSQHGFARDSDFRLTARTDDSLTFLLESNDETRKVYPFDFALETTYKIDDRRITVHWKVTNKGNGEMHFQIGAHPAFNFLDYDIDSNIRGYFDFDRNSGLKRTWIKEKGCVDTAEKTDLKLDGIGLLPISSHLFDHDAIVLDDSQVHEVTLYDRLKYPSVTLRFDAPVVGLWSPTRDAPFVCIEPWYGRADRTGYTGEFANRDHMQHLAPGQSFEGGYEIEIRK